MTPALHEREQTNIATLADALAIALKVRGAPDSRALLAVRTGVAAFALATTAWFDDPSLALGERLDLAFGELKSMLTSAAEWATARKPAKGAAVAHAPVTCEKQSPATVLSWPRACRRRRGISPTLGVGVEGAPLKKKQAVQGLDR